MGTVIGDILPLMIAIVLSPAPIMALVLIAASENGRTKTWVFTAGSLIGLFALTAVVTLVAENRHVYEADSEPAKIAAFLQLAFGLIFLGLAYKKWTTRPRGDEPPKQPGWLKMMGNLSVLQAFGFGVALPIINAKNIPILSSAGLTIARANLTGAEFWITVTIMSVLGVGALIGLSLAPVLFGERGERALIAVNEFMTRYANVIIMVICIILGANFIGKAIEGFSG